MQKTQRPLHKLDMQRKASYRSGILYAIAHDVAIYRPNGSMVPQFQSVFASEVNHLGRGVTL